MVPSIGRIVHVHPNGSFNLLNGVDVASAIVTQVFDYDTLNATVFVIDEGNPFMVVYNILPEDKKVPGKPFWSWPPRV